MPVTIKKQGAIDREKLEKVAFILKTVAHPTRLAVIHLLDKKGRMTVNELCSFTGCEQSLLSHHLNGMRLKGILKAEREGQNIFYSLKEKSVVGIMQCIENCNCNM